MGHWASGRTLDIRLLKVITVITMHTKFPQSKENVANIPAGGLNGAALNGSLAERSVVDITRSSRLFTPEIPAVKTCQRYSSPIKRLIATSNRVLQQHGSTTAALQRRYIHIHTDIWNCLILYPTPRLLAAGDNNYKQMRQQISREQVSVQLNYNNHHSMKLADSWLIILTAYNNAAFVDAECS